MCCRMKIAITGYKKMPHPDIVKPVPFTTVSQVFYGVKICRHSLIKIPVLLAEHWRRNKP